MQYPARVNGESDINDDVEGIFGGLPKPIDLEISEVPKSYIVFFGSDMRDNLA